MTYGTNGKTTESLKGFSSPIRLISLIRPIKFRYCNYPFFGR